jgi:hypothetical protein
MNGLEYAEKTYPFIDKTRECALGASYGGYMINWILGHSTRFKCLVSHDGMFNTESAYGSTEELWFPEWEFGDTVWANREGYRKWSPHLFVTQFKTPTLVVHGQLDYRLDVSEGFQLFTTLQRLKVPSRMLYFPDEGHWVLKPGNSELVWGSISFLILLGIFFWWEKRSDHPMLDVTFFNNPRFSAANAAITITFFAMFGSIFLLTQYLQFTKGYSPLESGVRMLPYAMTMMIVAPASSRVVERFGSKFTVALGLGLAALALLLMTGLTVDTAYADIAWRFVILAAGMGLVMAPATDSVMGSLPRAKAGVGSAVNDTTRQVGGALGVAIIGSVVSSVYGSKITEFFAGKPAPKAAVDAAKNSLGGAIAVSKEVATQPIPGAKGLSTALIHTANQAFVEAFRWGSRGQCPPYVPGGIRLCPRQCPPRRSNASWRPRIQPRLMGYENGPSRFC